MTICDLDAISTPLSGLRFALIENSTRLRGSLFQFLHTKIKKLAVLGVKFRAKFDYIYAMKV